jgi:hypothetical protein
MAQKKVINKVKNGDGYDTLFPQILSQVHYAKTVSGSSTAYTITIDMPAEEITTPIIVCFTPNVTNSANATININSLGAKALYLNNGAISASQISTSDKCLVYYDKTASSATLLSVSSFVKIPKATAAQAKAMTDDSVYLTPYVVGESILAGESYQRIAQTSKSNTTFTDTYNVTTGRLIHYDIVAKGINSSRYTRVRINGTNIGGTGTTNQYRQWNSQYNTSGSCLRLIIDIDTYTKTLKVTEQYQGDSNAITNIYVYDSLTNLVISSIGTANSGMGYTIFGYKFIAK